MRLWHYTCSHGRRGIGLRGRIEPPNDERVRAALAEIGLVPLVWLTADREADRDALGLGRVRTTCDRMAYLYVVLNHRAVPWVGSRWRTPDAVAALEGPDQTPDVWWVTDQAVPARLVRCSP